MDKLIGTNLGRYHVIEPLGEGGMASVYKAFDTSLERHVAIKIIRSDKKAGTEQNEFLKRFQREARALAQLDHPFILKVLDYGEQDGIPYLVMPFVPGGTLRSRMGSPIPYQEAARLLSLIAQALDYAHNRKVIHRDIKPANILLSEKDVPLLSDFGIAKIIESGESTQLTATGVGIGTPDYMAPEQWMGKADARTDIYSLGIVFFQMVTGHLPYSAETPAAVLIKHMQDPLPRPKVFVPGLPDSVEQVLFKALAKEPENRFPDMAAFADALAKLATGEFTKLDAIPEISETVISSVPLSSKSAQPVSTPQAVVTPPGKKKIPGWGIALIGLALLGGLVFIILLAGGAFLATRMAAQNKTPIPTNVSMESTPGMIQTSDFATTSEVTGNPLEITLESPTGNGSFQGIEGFPDDIPLLLENNGDLMTSISQGMTMYIFSTDLAFDQVVEFYKSGMTSNGWEMVSDTTQTDMDYITYMKGETRQVIIAITSDGSDLVQVMIMLQPEP